MSLSCDCSDDPDWWYAPCDPGPLSTKRMRRCCSCKARIAVGDECQQFVRWRTPDFGSVAERIHGDEEPMASWWLCERCSGLYESLDSLGFCDLLGQNLISVCKEYAQMQRDAGVFRGQLMPVRPVDEA